MGVVERLVEESSESVGCWCRVFLDGIVNGQGNAPVGLDEQLDECKRYIRKCIRENIIGTIIITGPSGSGKTFLSRYVMQKYLGAFSSIYEVHLGVIKRGSISPEKAIEIMFEGNRGVIVENVDEYDLSIVPALQSILSVQNKKQYYKDKVGENTYGVFILTAADYPDWLQTNADALHIRLGRRGRKAYQDLYKEFYREARNIAHLNGRVRMDRNVLYRTRRKLSNLHIYREWIYGLVRLSEKHKDRIIVNMYNYKKWFEKVVMYHILWD